MDNRTPYSSAILVIHLRIIAPVIEHGAYSVHIDSVRVVG